MNIDVPREILQPIFSEAVIQSILKVNVKTWK